MIDVERADERRHQPGPEPSWSESWSFDFATFDGSLGGYVELCLRPNLGVAWYWTALVGTGRPLVSVVEHHAPLPRLAGSLELRADGLWADQTCETPLEHWSLANEAFAVGLDHPADAYGRMLGDRVPLGFDLEWETDGQPVGVPGATTGAATGRYEVPCTVHGEVLVGDERVDLDGQGQRGHRWGVSDGWTAPWFNSAGRLDDGTRFQADVGGSGRGTGYVQRPGAAVVAVSPVTAAEVGGAEGLPISCLLDLGQDDLRLEVRPISFAPVLVGGTEEPLSRLPRALCRFVAVDGRTGYGWTQWNQPLHGHPPR